MAAAGVIYWMARTPQSIELTGIVNTDEVQVGPLIQGRLQKLLVNQGDTVKKGELLAVIQPEEWKADTLYYENSEKESAAQGEQAKADLEFLEKQTRSRSARRRPTSPCTTTR